MDTVCKGSRETAVLVFAIERLEPLILPGQAAFRGDVDNQQDPPGIVRRPTAMTSSRKH